MSWLSKMMDKIGGTVADHGILGGKKAKQAQEAKTPQGIAPGSIFTQYSTQWNPFEKNNIDGGSIFDSANYNLTAGGYQSNYDPAKTLSGGRNYEQELGDELASMYDLPGVPQQSAEPSVDVGALEYERDTKKVDIEQLNSDYQAKADEISNIDTQISTKDSEILSKNSEISNIDSQISSLQEPQSSDKKYEKTTTDEDGNETKEYDEDAYNADHEAWEAKKKELEDKKTTIAEEQQRLENEKQQIQSDIQQLESDKQQLESDKQSAETELNDLQRQIEEANQNNENKNGMNTVLPTDSKTVQTAKVNATLTEAMSHFGEEEEVDLTPTRGNTGAEKTPNDSVELNHSTENKVVEHYDNSGDFNKDAKNTGLSSSETANISEQIEQNGNNSSTINGKTTTEWQKAIDNTASAAEQLFPKAGNNIPGGTANKSAQPDNKKYEDVEYNGIKALKVTTSTGIRYINKETGEIIGVEKNSKTSGPKAKSPPPKNNGVEQKPAANNSSQPTQTENSLKTPQEIRASQIPTDGNGNGKVQHRGTYRSGDISSVSDDLKTQIKDEFNEIFQSLRNDTNNKSSLDNKNRLAHMHMQRRCIELGVNPTLLSKILQGE